MKKLIIAFLTLSSLACRTADPDTLAGPKSSGDVVQAAATELESGLEKTGSDVSASIAKKTKPLAAEKPNVLFIICDDLNDTIAGLNGHSQAITPNITRLAEMGVNFKNAHCNAAICAPSRASMWSGLHPVTTGNYGYQAQKNSLRNNPITKDAVTIMEHFKSNGYNVWGTGKVFHNGHEDNSVFTLNPDNDPKAGPRSWGPGPWDGKSRAYGNPKLLAHPYMPEHFFKWSGYYGSFGSLEEIPSIDGCEGWYADWRKDGPPRFKYNGPDDRDLMPDEISANWVIDKLQQDHEKPFFIVCGMNRPHNPMYAPQEFFDLFPIDDIKLPPYLENDLADVPAVLYQKEGQDENIPNYNSGELPRLLAAGDETPQGGMWWWKKFIQSYLACVAFVDHQVGVILDEFESSPHKDNTIIILTSDHGYHLGEKEHMRKNTIWDESSRVPFIVYAPGVTASEGVCDHPVSLIDCYPTLIDLCGLPEHPNADGNHMPLDGHSIRPFLTDPENGSWTGPSVALNVRYGPKHVDPGTSSPFENNHHSVRSKRYRYTLCSDGSEEFYDHEVDPHEWHNKADAPEYAEVKSMLKKELLSLTGQQNRDSFE